MMRISKISRSSLLLFIAAVATATLPSCSDDEIQVSPPAEIAVSDSGIAVGSDGRYYLLEVKSSSGESVLAHVDADWIELESDTVSESGSLTFYVRPNDGERSRDAEIILRSESGTGETSVGVHQLSEAEDDSNALQGDSITRRARVGFGYNMLIDYMNPACVTEPVLDYQKIVAAEQTWGTIIAEEGRAVQELTVHTSNTIEEMSSWMTKQSTTESKIFFTNKKTTKYTSVSEYQEEKHTYGFSSLSKTVATRYVDESKIESIIRTGGDIFSDKFREIYNRINVSPTQESVRELVRKFGTHLVIYADLGGRLDYTVNFRSKETSTRSVEKYLKYKNGKEQKNEATEEASHNICSNGDLSFDIYGGTQAGVRTVTSDSRTADRFAQISQASLGRWLGSVDRRNPASVAMISCRLMPIWQLFSNTAAREMIISHILYLARSEGGVVGTRLQELSLDRYYWFDITEGMLAFSDSPSATLVRVGYFDNLPKVEICNEYVPELRADRRVTVFYPIYNDMANIRRGIFAGDGDVPPSEVMFDSSGGCYVVPLEGYKPGERISRLYYIDGAFYCDNKGIDIPAVTMKLSDHTIAFNSQIKYPVVKIGPAYWTRTNIKESMEFGEPVDPDNPYCYEYYLYERIHNGMLYANIFYGNSLAFRENYPGVFDDSTDYSGNRVSWYVPRVSDIRTLEKYVGLNTKALFPGRQSGFEAQFAGYYGEYDDLHHGASLGKYDMRYEGEYCFIPAKESVVNSGEALVLSPDYTLRTCETNMARHNFYPLRPCRTSYYKYK